MRRAYDVDLATVGLLTTAFFLVHLLTQVPGGRLSDRLGARRVAVLALLEIAAANAIPLAGRDLALAFVGRALTGIGTGVGFVAGSDYVRTAAGGAFAQGVYGGLGVGGGGLALAIVPVVEGPAGWRAPWLTAVAVALAGALALAAAPREPRAAPLHRRERAAGVHRDGTLWRLAAMHSASFGLGVVVSNWTVTLLQRHGYGTPSAAAIASLTLLLGIFSRPLGGWIARARPQHVHAACAASLALGAAGTALLAAAEPPALVVAAAAVVGFAGGIPFAVAFHTAARARPDAPGTAVALVNATGSVAVVAGTPLVGLAFSLPGAGRIGFLAVAAAWAAALAVLPRRPELER